MMLCSTFAKAVFACKEKCGKTWTPLNFFRSPAFLDCFCSSVCLKRSSEVRKAWQWPVDHFWPTQMWVDLVSRSIFSNGKTLNNAESETRGACVYFWIANGNFSQVGGVRSNYQFCLFFDINEVICSSHLKCVGKAKEHKNAVRSLRW